MQYKGEPPFLSELQLEVLNWEDTIYPLYRAHKFQLCIDKALEKELYNYLSNHPLVKEAELKVIETCKERGISCGTQLSDFNSDSVKAALAMGYTFIIASSDLFVLDAWANSAERVMQGFRK